jgi:branched-chain amino acid transport system substrate-binding protein
MSLFASKRKAVTAAVAAVAAVALTTGTTLPANAADNQLTVGAIVPLTGALSFLVPPEIAGIHLALDEINAAGGVLGKQVKLAGILDEADGDSPAVSQDSATKLLAAKADLIIGAASSARTRLVINKITGAKVVQISGSNTAPDLTNWKDNGFYFRTAPSDLLQGRVLANQVLQDGASNVAILYQDTSYGVGLNTQAKAVLTKGKATVNSISFPETETNFASYIDKALAGKPDAIIIISYNESKKIIPALQAKGFSGGNLYLVDGNAVDYSAETYASYLNGAKASIPGKALDDAFKARLVASYKKYTGKVLTDFTYGESLYDAVIIGALAAQAAKDATGTGIKSQITEISKAGAGKVTVTSFAAGLKALKAGKKINYDGKTGAIEFDKNGDPTGAFIGIHRYSADGKFKLVKTVLGSSVK